MLPNLALLLLLFFISSAANAVTLTSSQTNYSTSADITSSSTAISSTLVGTSSSPNKITNGYKITTGNSGATSSAYAIKSTGSYNQITNSLAGEIYTTGSSGRGISIANFSTVSNLGKISTQGSSAYAIYAGGNENRVSNQGKIVTQNNNAYAIYLSGDKNQASNLGEISAKDYAIYANGDGNQISNLGTISTSSSTSAHGIYVSAGSSSNASASLYSTITNSGTINSSGNAIYVKDNYARISNSGTISGGATTSLYGIKNEGDNSSIENFGTISATKYAIYNSGQGASINNSGTLNGGVRMGDSTLNILGGEIFGDVDGSSSGVVNIGSNSANVDFVQGGDFLNLASLRVKSGSKFTANHAIESEAITLESAATFDLKTGSEILAPIIGAENSQGSLKISEVNFAQNYAIGALGASLANLEISANGSLAAKNNIYANEVLVAGSLNLNSTKNLTIFGDVDSSSSGKINLGLNNQKISGNFSLPAQSLLLVNANRNGAGKLEVSGLATVSENAKLQITIPKSSSFRVGQEFVLLDAGSGSAISPILAENLSVNDCKSNICGMSKFTTRVDGSKLLLKFDFLETNEISAGSKGKKIYQALKQISDREGGKIDEFQAYLASKNFAQDELDKTLKELSAPSAKSNFLSNNSSLSTSLKASETRLDKIRSGFSDVRVRNSSFKFLNNFFSQQAGKNSTRQLDIFNLEQEGGELANGIWVQPFRGFAHQDSVGDDDGYSANSLGMAFGADTKTANDAVVGVAFSLASSEVKSQDNLKKLSLNSYQLNFYHSKNFANFFIDNLGGISFSKFSSERAIPAVGANATAGYNGYGYIAKSRIGYEKKLNSQLNLIPEISLSFVNNHVDGYTEKGADSLNLQVGKSNSNFVEARTGVGSSWLKKSSHRDEFKKLILRSRLSYGYNLVSKIGEAQSSFAVQNSSSFSDQVAKIDRGSARLELGFDAYHVDESVLSFDYQIDKRASLVAHMILLKLRQQF